MDWERSKWGFGYFDSLRSWSRFAVECVDKSGSLQSLVSLLNEAEGLVEHWESRPWFYPSQMSWRHCKSQSSALDNDKAMGKGFPRFVSEEYRKDLCASLEDCIALRGHRPRPVTGWGTTVTARTAYLYHSGSLDRG